MPDLSFESKMSSLLRNITNSTEARSLLLHISCQSLKESVYMPRKKSALKKVIQWRAYQSIDALILGENLIKPGHRGKENDDVDYILPSI